jgi:hypothetical protein
LTKNYKTDKLKTIQTIAKNANGKVTVASQFTYTFEMKFSRKNISFRIVSLCIQERQYDTIYLKKWLFSPDGEVFLDFFPTANSMQ